jgi:hypothetical protein
MTTTGRWTERRGTFVELRVKEGRAVLAGELADEAAGEEREVDPHRIALGADLAEALHEWARVADAVAKAGESADAAAARLVSRRGEQLAGRVAAAMGAPVNYADPLTGEVTEIDVPAVDETAALAPRVWSNRISGLADVRPHAKQGRVEPTPWSTGLTVSAITAVLVLLVVVSLSLALGQANPWLALIGNLIVAFGLAPSVWLARRTPVWRWVAYGVPVGIVIAWMALLFTAL